MCALLPPFGGWYTVRDGRGDEARYTLPVSHVYPCTSSNLVVVQLLVTPYTCVQIGAWICGAEVNLCFAEGNTHGHLNLLRTVATATLVLKKSTGARGSTGAKEYLDREDRLRSFVEYDAPVLRKLSTMHCEGEGEVQVAQRNRCTATGRGMGARKYVLEDDAAAAAGASTRKRRITKV